MGPTSIVGSLKSTTLTSDHVWDGFLILTLLEDNQQQRTILSVPHEGEQRERYTAAIRARNKRIQMFGQEELRHCCNKCTRRYRNPVTGEGVLNVFCGPEMC